MFEALEGLRVIEIGTSTSGPYTSRQLANLGAEVIKVEPIGGDGTRKSTLPVYGDSALFHINNNDKKSISIDFKSKKGQEIIKNLVKNADVFIENFPAGRVNKWNLQYDVLKEINPRLIYCSINGFGQTGAYANKRALDTVVQARSGILSLNGDPENMPVKIGLSASDLLAASFAVVSIFAALHYRRKTGIGQHLDVAMFDVSAWVTEDCWPFALTGHKVGRMGNRSFHDSPSNLYRTQDGLVAIAVTNDEEWQSLLRVMGKQHLIGDERYAKKQDRLDNDEQVDNMVADWVQGLTVQEVVEKCQTNRIPSGPFQEISDVAKSSHTLERKMLVEIPHPKGSIKLIGSPFKMSVTPAKIHRPSPSLGAHTDELLGEMGFTNEEVIELRSKGIIV